MIVRQWLRRPRFNCRSRKMVSDSSLLNTQHYKVRMRLKWRNPGKRIALSQLYTHTHTHTHMYMCVCTCVCAYVCVCVCVCARVRWQYSSCFFWQDIYIYISKVGECSRGRLKAQSLIATSPRCRETHNSFFWFSPFYSRYVPYNAEC